MNIARIVEAITSFPERVRNRIASLLWARAFGCSDLHVHHTSHIKGSDGISLGDGFSSGRYLWLEAVRHFDGRRYDARLQIGNGFNCSELVHIGCAVGITIGDGVLLGSKVLITDHNHGTYSGPGPHSPPSEPPNSQPLAGRPVVIEDNVFIGDGVVVLPGSHIKAGAVVAAGSVVTGTLEAATMYAGIPARAIKRYDPASLQWLKVETSNP